MPTSIDSCIGADGFIAAWQSPAMSSACTYTRPLGCAGCWPKVASRDRRGCLTAGDTPARGFAQLRTYVPEKPVARGPPLGATYPQQYLQQAVACPLLEQARSSSALRQLWWPMTWRRNHHAWHAMCRVDFAPARYARPRRNVRRRCRS